MFNTESGDGNSSMDQNAEALKRTNRNKRPRSVLINKQQ